MKQKIAIIGSGISGLTCGYLLCNKFDIDVFESNEYIGGHTNTVTVDNLNIDTGFIVFNNRNYPAFQKMLDKLGVEYKPTEMSLSVRNDAWNLEYNGNTINSLFAQRSNIFKPKFLRLIYDILKFNRLVKKNLNNDSYATLSQFLIKHKFGKWFTDGYILPMGSAIWSMGTTEVLDFPFDLFAKFFNNHGLLEIKNHPQWYTICGGSKNYIPKITANFTNNIHLNMKVVKVIRHSNNVELVFANGEIKFFDEVIFACHSNQVLDILSNGTSDENHILKQIKYSTNEVILHTDTTLLPRKKLTYASWNYLIHNNSTHQATLTYNMNILQGLNTNKTYCVTLNSGNLIAPDKILAKFIYEHPIYTKDAELAQKKWDTISGIDRLHYCGAYWHNGFHEDGVQSALNVCKTLGVSFD